MLSTLEPQTANLRCLKDILGTENSVQLMSQKPVTTTYPWSGNKTRNTMRLERSFVETEDDGRLNWDFNAQTQVLVVNQNETNQYGEYRGYRSKFGFPTSYFHRKVDSQTSVAASTKGHSFAR